MQCTTAPIKQTGAPLYFQFDSTTVGAWLPFPAAIAWLAFLRLPSGAVDTAQFCSVEPPDTSITFADVLSYAFPAIALVNGAYARLADHIQQQAFSQYCECSVATSSAYSTRILSLGPYWYLKLGEAAGNPVALDSGPYHFTNAGLTNTNPSVPALIAGDPSTAIFLAGAQQVVFPRHSALDDFTGATSSSMEFWASVAMPGTEVTLYFNYNGSNEYVELAIDTAGKAFFRMRDNTATVYTSATTPLTVCGAAHQFDIVMNASTHELRLYVDATLAITFASIPTVSFSDGGENNYLGNDNHSGTPGAVGAYGHWSWFSGQALTSTEISDNYAAAGGTGHYNPPPFTPPPDGVPPPGVGPTCGTTQSICDELFRLEYLIAGMSQQLTSLSTWQNPQHWITGTAHPGLTGSGALATAGILGVRVQLTSVPAGWGQTGESPPRLIPSVGSIQAGYSGEYEDNHQVHYVDQLVMLKAGWAFAVRYNFRPGVVATVTELLPGS